MGVFWEFCGGISVEHALINSAVKVSSQRLRFLKRMSCSNKVICSGFNLKSEINVDLTPIDLHEAEAGEDGDELGEVEGDGCFMNFAKFRDGHEVVVLVDF